MIAFLGLGTMGYLMAGRLAGAGLDIKVYNRSPDKAKRWSQEYGLTASATPAEASKDASVVISCLSDDEAVKSVATGKDGAFSVMAKGGIFIDHSTGSANLARELAASASQLGLHFLDAPVTGGKPGAAKGTLTTMIGGNKPLWIQYDRSLLTTSKRFSMSDRLAPDKSSKWPTKYVLAVLFKAWPKPLHLSSMQDFKARKCWRCC